MVAKPPKAFTTSAVLELFSLNAFSNPVATCWTNINWPMLFIVVFSFLLIAAVFAFKLFEVFLSSFIGSISIVGAFGTAFSTGSITGSLFNLFAPSGPMPPSIAF